MKKSKKTKAGGDSKKTWSVDQFLEETPYQTVELYEWNSELNQWYCKDAQNLSNTSSDKGAYDWDIISDDDPPPEIEEVATPTPRTYDHSMTSITFVTYNVWFGTRRESVSELKPRFTALFDIIKLQKPDFICLQEMTTPINEILKEQKWLKDDGYWMTDPSRIPSGQYGVMMLSKWKVNEVIQVPLPSRLGRYLLVAKVNLNGSKVYIATSHLESIDSNKHTRKRQWKVIYKILQGAEHAFMMGDANFENEKERNSMIVKTYDDLWEVCDKDKSDLGETYDPDRNRMLGRFTKEGRDEKYKKERVDIIINKSKNKQWVGKSVKLLGTDPIPGTSPELYPSDHFGLRGEFGYVNKSK